MPLSIENRSIRDIGLGLRDFPWASMLGLVFRQLTIIKAQCDAIWAYSMRLKNAFASKENKNSALVSLTRTILVHWNHFFSHLHLRMARMQWIKTWKKWPIFSSLNTVYSKNRQKFHLDGFLVKINLKSFLFGLSGMLLLVRVRTKFQFPVSYDLKNAKLFILG